MKLLFINSLLLAGSLMGCLQAFSKTPEHAPVIFSGIAIPEDRGKNVEVWCDNALSLIGDSRNFTVTTRPDGRFSKTLRLDRPAYYFFGYNTIYLSPGDTLRGVFDNYDNKTTYTGTNSAINNYLKGTVGSHSGSYISIIGANHLDDLTAVSRQTDSLAAARRKELAALNAPAAFKDMEEARIKADIVNTYFSIPFYRGMEKKEEDSLLSANKTRLAPLVRAICRDNYMDLDVVRSVVADCARSSFFKDDIVWTPRMTELFRASALADLLGQQPDADALAEADRFLASCATPDIKAELQRVRDRIGNLVKGAPAPDLRLTAPDGKAVALSDFKGKYIYVDLWATWCSPCMKESPLFHQLAEKYTGNYNLVFLSISIDSNTRAWQQFLTHRKSAIPEYNCADTKGLGKWNVTGIPRFILIGKDFKIINANAPAPSETEKIETELHKLN